MVTRNFEQNLIGITKWILYLSAIQKGDKIDLEQIQQALFKQDRQKVSENSRSTHQIISW